MKMNDEDIRQLTERFFEGETTLEEEETLYAYYNGADISPDLEMYAELFCGFAAIPLEADKTEKQPATTRPVLKWIRRIAVAASILLLAGVGINYLLPSSSSDEECVAYIYGKKYTDPDLVSLEMHRTMSEMSNMDEENVMESQLIDLFTTE